MWTAGFAVHPIAAASGLEVTENGQIVVDRTMRSVSHPDVYAVGDSAYAIGDNGRPLPMSCASAGFTGMQATAAIVGRLTGREIANTSWSYLGNHISLGRRDAILQMVDGDARAKPRYLGGRTAARIKAGILKTAAVEHRAPDLRHAEAQAPPGHRAGRARRATVASPHRVVRMDSRRPLDTRFEASRNRLASLAYRLLGSAADAEDAVQDAFLRWQAADRRADRGAGSVADQGRHQPVPRPAPLGAGAPRTRGRRLAARTAPRRRPDARPGRHRSSSANRSPWPC